MSESHDRAPRPHPVDFDDFFRHELVPLTRWLIFSGATLTEAQDAIQTAMTVAYLNWGSIESPRAFVRTVAIRHHRRERARAHRDLHATGPATEPQTTPHFDFHAEAERVRLMLAALPAAQRYVIALTIDGYTPKEIASILAQPAATVRSNLRHARRALRHRLGHSHHPAIREEAHDGP